MVTVLAHAGRCGFGGCGPVQCYPTRTPMQNPRLVRAITVKVTRVAQAKTRRATSQSQAKPSQAQAKPEVSPIPNNHNPKAKPNQSRAGKTLVVGCRLCGLVHSFEFQLKQGNGTIRNCSIGHLLNCLDICIGVTCYIQTHNVDPYSCSNTLSL